MKYKVIWGSGFEQHVSSKTEAIKIASELLSEYDSVRIERIKK